MIVPLRLIETEVEIPERMNRKPEKDIPDTSEFFRDEAVMDFCTPVDACTWRVSAAGFDFSCLGKEKARSLMKTVRRVQQVIIDTERSMPSLMRLIRRVLKCFQNARGAPA